jgi:hypothetical protein
MPRRRCLQDLFNASPIAFAGNFMSNPVPQIVDPEAPTVNVMQAEPGSVLVELMEQCLAHLEAGEDVDREALVAAHPELQSQIDACLASLQFIHRAVQPTEGIPARLADFRIVREIGRGGMGVVYEAEQISLKRQVALKVLRFGAVADPEAMKRFQREAETIASLHHTNIVPVFAVGMEKSIHYYAMQLIEGRSLREVAQDSTADPISNKTIAQWGLQAAEALAHAHERGVVHRDIKPGNLILGLDGRIWLTDFGLAKRLDDVTLSLCGALLGTPRYMSPEQASVLRHPVDHRTDIYSLGATLYELVTKRPLFDSDSPHIVISQILTTEPKPPREFAPSVPRDLETIILKCLCKDAGQRYQYARELADDLRAFTEGRAIKARRATVAERAGRWLKQNGRLLTATVATVAVTAALVIGGTEWWERSSAASNGRLMLTTKEGPLSGEVRNASGEQVVPSFTVPNEQPALVPEGEYQLRAIGRGSLSKTGWMTLNRGPAQEIAVDIGRPELYPAVALNSMMGYEFIDFGTGPDLVVMPESPTSSDLDSPESRAKPNILARCSGITGKEIWTLDISQNSPALRELLPTDELRSQWWSATVFGWKFANQPPLRALRPLPDLDADGVPDLVWRLHQGYSLFAVSGKTGRPLWWYVARFTDAESKPIEAMSPQTGLRRQIGDAALAAIPGPDNSTVPVVIVAELGIRSREDGNVSARVSALDARDKSSLWSIEVPGISPRLAIASSSGTQSLSSSRVVVVAEMELLTLDLSTGSPIGLPMKLVDGDSSNGILYSTPHVVDVDADGQPEVLLTQEEPNTSPSGVRLVSLSAAGPGTDATRPNWSLVFAPAEQKRYFIDHRDLNGDGTQEILLTSERQDFDCRVLDGRTGNEIWRRRRPSNVFVGRHSAPVVGDDLDGDGWRDVFVVSIDNDAVSGDQSAGMKDDGHSLFVDCFSGRSGRSLWWTKTPAVGKSSPFLHPFVIPPRWWGQGLTGQRSLLISAFLEPKSSELQGYSYVVDAATGRIEEMASNLAAAEPIDLNGDGRDELVAVKILEDRDNSNILSNLSGELRVFQGENPTGWRRFGQWRPLMDLDGDGLSELLPYSHRNTKLPMISGRDGKQIADWGSNENINEYVPLTAPSLDLDGDGLSEVLAVHDTWYQHVPGSRQPLRSRALGVDLISPKTRSRFWRAPQISAPPWDDIEQIQFRASKPHWKDLDGDGELEIIVPYNWQMSKSRIESAEARSQCGLAILEARTGHLKWNEILKEEPGDRNSSWHSSQDWMQSLQFGDLDHDGVQDLLVTFSAMPWSSNWKREMLVQAVSGRDGHQLWPEIHARLYQPPEGLGKQQQEAFSRNSSLQQFITEKKGVLQAAIANIDGKPGGEVVVLSFIPQPNPERPFLDGQLILQVLDGGTGKLLFENRWPGMIHPNDMTAQKLLTLHRTDRDVIVISKAKYDPQRREPMNNEDWLMSVPQPGDAVAADRIPELEVLETHKTHPDDQVWKFDLNGDAIDELICWRASERYDVAPELVVSRGLNDEQWKRVMPKLTEYSAAKIKLLEAGKALLISKGQMNVVVSSDGRLLSQFATPNEAGIDLVLGSDGWMSRWAIGQAPRVIVSEKSQTRSDLILPTDDSGRASQVVPAEKIVITPQPNPRNLRQLPWMRNSIALCFATESIAWAVMMWLLIIAPLQLVRWAWPRRTHVWPAICLIVVACAGAYAMFRIAVILYSLVMNRGSSRVAWEMVAVMFAVGLPLACSPSMLIRSIRKEAKPTLLKVGLAILIATAGFVTLMFGTDLNTQDRFDAYRLDGWYLALVAGVVCGVWLLVMLRWLRQGALVVIGSRRRAAGARIA